MDVNNKAGRRNPVLMDASSAIILFKSSFIEPVVDYFRIIMAGSVYSEITREGRDGAVEFKRLLKEARIQIHNGPGCDGRYDRHLERLGDGERDLILLYKKGIGDMILLDDRKGALYCRKNFIPYVNSLLVPRILHLGGRIEMDERNRVMESIKSYGRYSHAIIEYAYGCGDEILAKFL